VKKTYFLVFSLLLSCQSVQKEPIENAIIQPADTIVINIGNAHQIVASKKDLRVDFLIPETGLPITRLYEDSSFNIYPIHNSQVALDLYALSETIDIAQHDSLITITTHPLPDNLPGKAVIGFNVDPSKHILYYHHKSYTNDSSNVFESLIKIDSIGTKTYRILKKNSH